MNFEILVQLAQILVALLAGGMVVPAVNWIKEKVSLQGWGAWALSAAVALLFGAATVLAEGQLTASDFAWDNIATIFAVVYAASQSIYAMLDNK
jgi:hypothetical protein